jgi:multicomponent Na+:H+ antiporter subunit G
MSLLLDILSWVFLLVGGALMVVSALGIIRLPDIFTRLHAASIADTGGAFLLLTGMLMQADSWQVAVKLAMIGIILFLTTPTASHAVAHAALIGGLSPDDPKANRGNEEIDRDTV